MQEKVDVFIGNHASNNKTDKKIEKLLSSKQNPFIVENEWEEFLKERLNRLQQVIESDK